MNIILVTDTDGGYTICDESTGEVYGFTDYREKVLYVSDVSGKELCWMPTIQEAVQYVLGLRNINTTAHISYVD